MAPLVLVLMILQLAAGNEHFRKPDNFMDHLSNGMKFATDFLGSDSVALKVAEFVVKAFRPANRPGSTKPQYDELNDTSQDDESFAEENRPNYSVNDAPNPMSPLKYLVRLFGLQPSQISAVAVNALVFVAQMITTFLVGNKRRKNHHRSEDPADWILNKRSQKLQQFLSRAKNASLSEDIEDIVRDQGDEEETDCIRLLVCKITPFVRKMQDSVFNAVDLDPVPGGYRGAEVMYKHLPSAEEITTQSDVCERKHRDCDLNEEP
ncbi:hypothetical protein ACJJTC_009538 [Scirpophaga incertulas]